MAHACGARTQTAVCGYSMKSPGEGAPAGLARRDPSADRGARMMMRERLVEQLQGRNDVLLVPLRQYENPATHQVEEARVVRRHVLESLRRVVVELGRGETNATELRDLERLDVLQLVRRIVRVQPEAGDQRQPRIRAEHVGLIRHAAVENKFPDRILRGVELRDRDADKTRTRDDRQADEGGRELVSL